MGHSGRFQKWMAFRTSSKQLRQTRTELSRIGYTVSELIRACIAALLSEEDRARILRILKKHLPEVATMIFGPSVVWQ